MTLCNGYGLSEAMLAVAHVPGLPAEALAVGRAAGRRPAACGSSTTTGAEVATGEVGEIIVHGIPGRTIMQGYYKDPEATAAAIRDGWLHTGDNGWVDELRLPVLLRPQEGRDQAGGGERVGDGGRDRRCSSTPRSRWPRSSRSPTRSATRRSRRSSCAAPAASCSPRRSAAFCARAPRPFQGADDRRAARRAAAHVGRQGREEGAACLSLTDVHARLLELVGALRPRDPRPCRPPGLRALRGRVRGRGPGGRRAADVPHLDHRVGRRSGAVGAARGRDRRRARRLPPARGPAPHGRRAGARAGRGPRARDRVHGAADARGGDAARGRSGPLLLIHVRTEFRATDGRVLLTAARPSWPGRPA